MAKLRYPTPNYKVPPPGSANVQPGEQSSAYGFGWDKPPEKDEWTGGPFVPGPLPPKEQPSGWDQYPSNRKEKMDATRERYPDIGSYLTGIFNGGGVNPTEPGFDQRLDAAGQMYGFEQGDQGYPAWYPDSQTIGTVGGYLSYEPDGSWKFNPRSPGVGGGGGEGGGPLIPGADSPLNTQLQSSMLEALQYGLNRDKFNTLWEAIMGNVEGLGGQHNKNLETLIEGTNKSRNSQLKNIQAILADRGLLSEPGHTQGIESSSYANLEDSLGQQYATGLRDLQGREFEQQNNLFQSASDLLNQENSAQLGVLNAASGHQAQLGQLTVQMLDQNRQWNTFLAQLGLDREKVMADIANGNISQWMNLIQAFIQTLGTAAQGQV